MAKLSARGNGAEVARLTRTFRDDDDFTATTLVVVMESGKVLRRTLSINGRPRRSGFKVWFEKALELDRFIANLELIGYRRVS